LLIQFAALAKPGDIKGKVRDDKETSVAAASVILLQLPGNTLYKTELTSDNGTFSFEGVPDGKYLLKVVMAGYEPYSSKELNVGSSNVELNDIVLLPKAGMLKEQVVRANKPFVEVKPDMLVVNVENSIVSAGSSALEVLQRSPGVRVDQNDNISLKGKQGVLIMIDGKLTPLSGTDLANVLKSMPANNIDKIELISNPGARYDAAGTAGIINIKTKKNQLVGFNGSVNASYAQGVYPKVNTGFNLNYRNKKLNAFVNYSYAYRYWFNNLKLDRRFYDSTGKMQSAYIQDNYAVFDFKNHIASGGIDYYLSPKTTLGVVLNVSTNDFDPKADNNSKEVNANRDVVYYFNTIGRHNNSYYNHSGNLNLRHSFDSAGRQLSVDVDYAVFGNQSNQHFTTTYTGTNGLEYRAPYYMNSDLTGITTIKTLKADYVHPLSAKMRLDAGIKSSLVTADNEPLFYEKLSGGEFILDPLRSNHFIYNENINASYVNINKEWEKWGAQLGLRAEQTNAQWEQKVTNQKYDTTYLQLFPSIAVQRHINPKHDLGITLSRRIERPNYQQLNPFKFFIDKTTYREGYPYLKPATSYSAEVSHTYRQRFVTTFTYMVTDNVIAEIIQPSENDTGRVTVQTNKNLDRMTFYGLSIAYTFQIAKWWTNVTNGNFYYARYEGNVANTVLNNGRPTFDLNTNNSFVLPKNFAAELGLFYQARQIYGFMDVKPNWMLNAGVQKNFWDKRATIRLNVQDIFWKGYPRATSTYTGYQEDFIAIRDTRQATISFTYRFGKTSIPQSRRRGGGAEEEKRRAG
jgi:hypothetical protein